MQANGSRVIQQRLLDGLTGRSSVPNLSATMTRILAISVNGAVWPALTVRHATLCSPVAIVCRAGLAYTHAQSVAMWGTERTLDPNAREDKLCT